MFHRVTDVQYSVFSIHAIPHSTGPLFGRQLTLTSFWGPNETTYSTSLLVHIIKYILRPVGEIRYSAADLLAESAVMDLPLSSLQFKDHAGSQKNCAGAIHFTSWTTSTPQMGPFT